MNISVAGLGYVGLSLACLLSKHNDVTAIDIDERRVADINNGISPIKDPFIEDYLAAASRHAEGDHRPSQGLCRCGLYRHRHAN